jgi:hypothetical protein
MNADLMQWEVTEYPDGSIVDDVTGSTLLPPIFELAFENLAAFVAHRYGNDMLDEGRQSIYLLRSLVDTYPEVFESIEINPHIWSERVNAYLGGE